MRQPSPATSSTVGERTRGSASTLVRRPSSACGFDIGRDKLRGGTESGAVFDPRAKFRYVLWRQWDETRPRLCFVLLNPSTADHEQNDPTISRCLAFAKRWRFGGVDIVNLFALRSTDPRGLYECKDPVGPRNDEYIRAALRRADRVVLAWGNHGLLADRHEEVLSSIAGQAYCFGITKLGQPKHPLYIAAATKLKLFG